jgi:hypothetical protein
MLSIGGERQLIQPCIDKHWQAISETSKSNTQNPGKSQIQALTES